MTANTQQVTDPRMSAKSPKTPSMGCDLPVLGYG
jgi:hypothetical protein